MRLDRVMDTPPPFSETQSHFYSLNELLEQKIVRVVLGVIALVSMTHFYTANLKSTIKMTLCLSCLMIMVHTVAYRLLHWIHKPEARTPNSVLDDVRCNLLAEFNSVHK